MNKYFNIINIILVIHGCILTATGQYVTINGKKFIDPATGNPFFIKMINFNAQLVCNDVNSPNPIYKIIRHRQYGTEECFLEPTSRYSSINTCELSIEDDFEKIKEMGFNAVRFLLIPNCNSTIIEPGGFHIYAEQFSPTDMCHAPKKTLNIGPLDYLSPTSDAQTYFSLIAHVLDLADNHNLKVIIICADHPNPGSYIHSNGSTKYFPEMGSSMASAIDYASYLKALASALKNKPALLAYDIFPEPSFSWYLDGRNENKKKNIICEYTEMWYDAINSVDQNHLVTLSGTDHGDVWVWDNGVMKLDFISMHIYPYPDRKIPGGTSIAIQKTKDLITWCSNNLQRPWILGETGFQSAEELCLRPYLWGNVLDQENYLLQILPYVRDCGGSGFNLWDFQDIHFYCIPNQICPIPGSNQASCNSCDSWNGYCGAVPGSWPAHFTPESIKAQTDLIGGQYYGLLKYGNPLSSGLYPSNVDKPGLSVIRNFDYLPPSVCEPSPDYYNPDRHPLNPIGINGQPSSIHGRILNQYNQPVKDAVILGYTPLKHLPNGSIDYDLHYTFSDAYGNFILIPEDWDVASPNTNSIDILRISTIVKTFPFSDIV